MVLPVVFTQFADFDVSAGTRRLDETTIAEIDAHMVGGAAVGYPKEHQIAAFQFAFLDRRGVTQVEHLVGGARNRDSHHIFISVIHQSAAIETGVGVAPPQW